MSGTVAEPASTGRSTTSAVVLSFVVDLVLVVVFVLIGRRSHAEALDLAGIAATAWPFAVALLVGWAVARAWRSPVAVWPTGVIVWAVTVVGGLALRVLAGDTAQVPFMIVATVTLAVFLIGWRAIVALVRRLRGRARASA
ncbi:MAG TPA: DUF3054 domain-containing protein [Agromyces sp.]